MFKIMKFTHGTVIAMIGTNKAVVLEKHGFYNVGDIIGDVNSHIRRGCTLTDITHLS